MYNSNFLLLKHFIPEITLTPLSSHFAEFGEEERNRRCHATNNLNPYPHPTSYPKGMVLAFSWNAISSMELYVFPLSGSYNTTNNQRKQTALRDENGRKRVEKLISCFCFYIFSRNGIGFGRKTELKRMGIYGNTKTNKYGRKAKKIKVE